MSSMNARETFCWWPYGGFFFQKIIMFKGHLTTKIKQWKTQMLTHFVKTREAENFQKSSDFGAAWLCSVWWYSKRGVHIESTNKPWSSRIMVFLKRSTLPFSWSQVWKKVHLQLNAFCHSFGVPIPKSVIFKSSGGGFLREWPITAQKGKIGKNWL